MYDVRTQDAESDEELELPISDDDGVSEDPRSMSPSGEITHDQWTDPHQPSLAPEEVAHTREEPSHETLRHCFLFRWRRGR